MRVAMKSATLVVAACLAMASPAAAQTDQELIDKVVLAAPANARADATVVKWGADGKRVVVRQGKNGLACWDQAAWGHSRVPFNVHCTAEAGLGRVEQNREFYVKASSREEAEKAIQAAEKEGKRVPPVWGAAFYGLSGADAATARGHVTIAVPGATPETLKMPAKPTASGAWIMDSGTTAAHIMVPGH
ncbi:MAG TPA: hypothetical protein VFD69_04695 [Vicinamibacterales bacterium]|nr:hypothetical protein [Vicinamibacterales bacterium]